MEFLAAGLQKFHVARGVDDVAKLRVRPAGQLSFDARFTASLVKHLKERVENVFKNLWTPNTQGDKMGLFWD
jgi:hypothetical protein